MQLSGTRGSGTLNNTVQEMFYFSIDKERNGWISLRWKYKFLKSIREVTILNLVFHISHLNAHLSFGDRVINGWGKLWSSPMQPLSYNFVRQTFHFFNMVIGEVKS